LIPLLDLNVLVSAHRKDIPGHAEMFKYLSGLRSGHQFFGVPELVLSGVIRISTNSRVFKVPSTSEEALNFNASITLAPKCLLVRPSETHRRVFENLVRQIGARGNLVPDAYLAAMAIDQGFEFITNDADFGRFPGLTWRKPLETQSTTNPN
jgi:uncharacterized protein